MVDAPWKARKGSSILCLSEMSSRRREHDSQGRREEGRDDGAATSEVNRGATKGGEVYLDGQRQAENEV